jgi:high affinity Mn2+ porin
MALCAALPAAALAQPTPTPEMAPSAPEHAAVHAQATLVVQGNTAFPARFSGPQSLRARGETRETVDVTVFAGFEPWPGAEIWINPEVDQGFGLSNTLGAAGFPSGEAYKVGRAEPYLRLQRGFLRQTIALGGAARSVTGDANVLARRTTENRLVLTIGKFGVADVFDTNAYAHDPRGDFLNWTLIDAGAFDYPADAWGYSLGGAAELYWGKWALRVGAFNLSTVPNSETLETDFRQYGLVGEIERRVRVRGRPGAVRVLLFANRGRMARLDEAVRLGAPGPPDLDAARRFQTRVGASFNAEQEVARAVGVFLRASIADGRYEAFEFTDVDASLSMGVSAGGERWGRPRDRLGLGAVVNAASRQRKRFLAAGGLGILVGDGALPRPGEEWAFEGWYAWGAVRGLTLTADAQLIANPAYNRDRGPIPVFALRAHAAF